MNIQDNVKLVKVFSAVRALTKPWSKGGGARLSEIAWHAKLDPRDVSLILVKLALSGKLVELKEHGRYTKSRWYVNIYPPELAQWS